MKEIYRIVQVAVDEYHIEERRRELLSLIFRFFKLYFWSEIHFLDPGHPVATFKSIDDAKVYITKLRAYEEERRLEAIKWKAKQKFKSKVVYTEDKK
jgi:hypothetical protein